MAKLIGTAPNQVPTNADLGTMAYRDYENVANEFAFARPNLVINGDFQVWQRSDNNNTGGAAYPSADRFKATRGRIRKPNTNGNSGEEERGAVLDTTDGSVYVHFDYYIEDRDMKLEGKELVMSFEAKSVGGEAGGWGLYMENSGMTGGRLDIGGNRTVTVVPWEWRKIVLHGTVTYNATSDNFHLPRWYINPTGSGSNRMLQIDKLKVEVVENGYKNPTPFVSKPYHEELAACQRYYNKASNMWMSGQSYGNSGSVDGLVMPFRFPVDMRISSPTIAFSGGSDGGSQATLHSGGTSTSHVNINLRSQAGDTYVWYSGFTVTADAEI